MNVQELITTLKKYPQDSKIAIKTTDDSDSFYIKAEAKFVEAEQNEVIITNKG